jgi:hypothetical protein
VQELTGEHRLLASMAAGLAEPARPADSAAQAAAISALFAGHVDKEDSSCCRRWSVPVPTCRP